MKKILFALLALTVCVVTNAQTCVVDTDGEPMIGAAVLDSHGTPIAIVSETGMLEAIPAELYPITVHSLGYEDIVVAQPTSQIVLTPKAYTLNEVTVRPGERPECRIVCYARERSCITNTIDTVRALSEYMVDFMLPAFKARDVVEWKHARILNRNCKLIKSSDDIDFSDDYATLLEFCTVLARMDTTTVNLHKDLRGRQSGKAVVKAKKTGDEEYIHSLSPSGYSLYYDALANTKKHRFKPGILKLLGMTMEINECWEQSRYVLSDDSRFTLDQLVARTYSLRMDCTGKMFHVILGGKHPVTMTSYIELFPVEISYLTREEAKQMKQEKKPQKYPMTIPDTAK